MRKKKDNNNGSNQMGKKGHLEEDREEN